MASTALLLYLYVTIRTFLALQWLYFCRWIVQPKRVIKPVAEYCHKMVIIGDGFALGFGDGVYFGHCGGIAHYLTSLIRKEVKIRHKWQILNQGIANTTAIDWSPTSEKHVNCFIRFEIVF